MREVNADGSCQTCFRPTTVDGSQPQTQWISVCRCDRPYSPNAAQVSIEVCAKCQLRVPFGVGGQVNCAGLCSCAQPDARKIPTYIKQNESDAVVLDLAAVGMSPETFPVEKYTPIAILGQGARAVTVLARDRQRGTKVAVKCFKRIAPALKSTFESEVRKNKELTHATIAKVVDYGFPGGNKAPYLVSEYKDGFNIEQCLAMHGTPSSDVAVKVLIAVCEAVVYAQKQGVLHRDIRPGNIVFVDDMNSEPSVSILDFALPKIKMSEQLTEPVDALFMSADEARGLEYTEKSEVYTIGCVGYSLLTGSPPFKDGTALEIKNMHGLKLPPKISGVKFDNKRPKELEEIIERCLEKDPGYRFDTIPKLLERLEVFPRRVQMQRTAVLAARQRKKILLIASIVLAIVALLAVGYFVLRPH